METIEHSTIPISALLPCERNRMFWLMQECYLGIDRLEFERDLEEKQSLMVLREKSSGLIVGFSTLLKYQLLVEGDPITILFSGDTVVRKEQRSSLGFAVEITAFFAEAIEASPYPVYYLLTSKGWRTYRVLPLLFRNYYPSRLQPTPASAKRIIDAFGRTKFPFEYLPDSGLIVHQKASQRLRPHSDEAECCCRFDPEAEFFFRRNPNFLRGDELVCLAPVSLDNFSKASLRLLGARVSHA